MTAMNKDTNQPPHHANNDYAVKVIQEEMTELQANHINSDTLTYGQLFKKLKKLIEKLKS